MRKAAQQQPTADMKWQARMTMHKRSLNMSRKKKLDTVNQLPLKKNIKLALMLADCQYSMTSYIFNKKGANVNIKR